MEGGERLLGWWCERQCQKQVWQNRGAMESVREEKTSLAERVKDAILHPEITPTHSRLPTPRGPKGFVYPRLGPCASPEKKRRMVSPQNTPTDCSTCGTTPLVHCYEGSLGLIELSPCARHCKKAWASRDHLPPTSQR